MKAGAPDWWGEIAPTPTGLTEDRYVSAVEVREVNDVDVVGQRASHGGRPLRLPPHDLADASARAEGRARPHRPVRAGRAHRPDARHHYLARARGGPRARLLRSEVRPPAEGRLDRSSPTRSTCTPTGATRRHAWRSASSSCRKGYKPEYRPSRISLGNGVDIDIKAEAVGPGTARLCRAHRAHQDPVVRAAPARAGRAHVPRGDLGLQHADAQLRRLRPQLGARLRLRRRLTRRCCRRAPSCTSSATWTTRRRTRTCPTRATGRARAIVRWPTCSSTSATACRSPTSSSWPR